jgi:hypothetical protein
VRVMVEASEEAVASEIATALAEFVAEALGV